MKLLEEKEIMENEYDSMNNEELIKKYEDTGIEYNILLRELLNRYLSKELTDVEWTQIKEISSRRGSEIFDCFTKGIDKTIMKECMGEVVEMLSDKNR